MISLTSSAVAHLKDLITDKGASADTTGLRLRVEKGGCAGMQYVMGLDQSHTGDSIHTQDGVSIFVDA